MAITATYHIAEAGFACYARRMLRKASLVVVLAILIAPGLAGCGAGRDRGPAWPEPHEREADGGESLAPRQPGAVAEIEKAEDATPGTAAPPDAPGTAGAAAALGSDRPAPEDPAHKDPDILTTEEIVIEIED
jgi:hypothetical protein